MSEYTDLQEGTTAAQEQSQDVRKALNDAYAFVEGSKAVQSFSAFTVEEAHDRFIEQVEGKGTAIRPNMLSKIDTVVSKVTAVVESIKAAPPEAFAPNNPGSNVNT